MYETWFTNHTGNARLDNLEDIRNTFLQGGWYRANLIPNKLTLLSFNSLQMNSENEQNKILEEIAELDWLEAQLTNADFGEKFILQMHIYDTTSFWKNKAYANWIQDEHQERYFSLMKVHADKVLLEVTGHEHLAGLRYSANEAGFYLNKVLFPGFTGAGKISQPGFATFEFDSATDTVQALKFTFVDIDGTIGLPKETTFQEFPWSMVDFEKDFDLKNLDGGNLEKFVQRLEADPELARKFQFSCAGVVDMTNSRLVTDAVSHYKQSSLLRKDATNNNAFTWPRDFGKTACIMRHSK